MHVLGIFSMLLAISAILAATVDFDSRSVLKYFLVALPPRANGLVPLPRHTYDPQKPYNGLKSDRK
jgi:hypothetical protein